jgi:hypothetical protein
MVLIGSFFLKSFEGYEIGATRSVGAFSHGDDCPQLTSVGQKWRYINGLSTFGSRQRVSSAMEVRLGKRHPSISTSESVLLSRYNLELHETGREPQGIGQDSVKTRQGSVKKIDPMK